MDTILPKWLAPGVIVYHKPTCILFPAYHCQRESATGKVILLDAPKGEPCKVYLLEECEPATPNHFQGVALMSVGGKPVSVVCEGNHFVLSNGKRTAIVRREDETDRAAQSMAAFFNGEIVGGIDAA
jgi:hypothetical protein